MAWDAVGWYVGINGYWWELVVFTPERNFLTSWAGGFTFAYGRTVRSAREVPLMTKQQEQERQQALTELRENIEKGSTVYTILRHASASGMSRSISCIVMEKTDEGVCRPYEITYLLRRAGFGSFDEKNGGIKRQGAGMDMGFDLVYSLSREICNGDGYALKQEWL